TLTATPDRFHLIAEIATGHWRQAQALVLTGQSELIPDRLVLDERVSKQEPAPPAAMEFTPPIAMTDLPLEPNDLPLDLHADREECSQPLDSAFASTLGSTLDNTVAERSEPSAGLEDPWEEALDYPLPDQERELLQTESSVHAATTTNQETPAADQSLGSNLSFQHLYQTIAQIVQTTPNHWTEVAQTALKGLFKPQADGGERQQPLASPPDSARLEELPEAIVPSGDLTRGDRVSEDLTSGDLVSSDLASRDLVSGDLVSSDLASRDLVSRDLASGGDLTSDDDLLAVTALLNFGREDLSSEDLSPGDAAGTGLDLDVNDGDDRETIGATLVAETAQTTNFTEAYVSESLHREQDLTATASDPIGTTPILTNPFPSTPATFSDREEGTTNLTTVLGLEAVKTNTLGELTETPSSAQEQGVMETTVRVPLWVLEQLNNQFGELIIQRNALNLRLKNLQDLVQKLHWKMQGLDQANSEIRSFYDRLSTQGDSSRLSPTSMPRPDAQALLSQVNLAETFDLLEKDHYGDLHLLSQEQIETIVQLQEVVSDLDLGLTEVNQASTEMNRTVRQMQSNVTKTRMRPFSDITGRLPRLVRDLSLQFNKSATCQIQGGNTLVDRSVLEALADPLMHLIRNAFDHGLESQAQREASGKPETGRIEVQIFQRGNHIVIQVEDDGRGIDLHKIRDRAVEMGLDADQLATVSQSELLDLIFEPGFSTAQQVTNLSGRGVGMDVVKTNLKKVRGEISIDTALGQGTRFTLTVPLTLSVLRVLVVESHDLMMAIPTDVVEEMLILHPELLLQSADHTVFCWNEMMIPLLNLREWVQYNCPHDRIETEAVATIDKNCVLVLNQGTTWTALQIDRFWGEQEVAVRPVESHIPLPTGFSNCTILGDGRVIPVVEVNQLLQSFGEIPSAHTPQPQSLLRVQSTAPTESSPSPTILIVDDSINVRRYLALILSKAGYRTLQAKDGQDAVEQLKAGAQVNAVICDVEMPRLDGYGVIANLRAEPRTQHIPILMLTSRTGEKHRKLALTLGANAYFSKPCNEQSMLQTLQELINTKPAAIVSSTAR
ncbi:MAG: hypothetical protein RLZZ435_131, partial [Cyanobacteriota bacterium]